MTVFVVFKEETFCGTTTTIMCGIFSTEEKAQAFIETRACPWHFWFEEEEIDSRLEDAP